MTKEVYDDFDSMLNTVKMQKTFVTAVVVSQIVGIGMITMVGYWLGHFQGGYGWDPKIVFNFHPLFMTIGLVFFYGDALLVYRLFRNVTKIYIKILHVVLHVAALIFSSIALKAVFDSHNLALVPIPNLYSIHSWVGLSAFILFGLQWVLGFVSFLFPKLSESFRRFYLPHHKFWGVVIFAMCCATCLMGITEKFIFAKIKDFNTLPPEMILINFFGISIVVYGTLIVYLVTKFEYARKDD